MIRKAIIEISCILLALLFMYTGVSKFLDYDVFQTQIRYSPLVKDVSVVNGWAGNLAWTIPAFEIFIALLLAFNIKRRLVLIFSTVTMLVFTCYIGYVLSFAPFVPCSCGGVLESLTWHQHLYFNLAFLAIGFCGVMLYSNQVTSKSNNQGPKTI